MVSLLEFTEIAAGSDFHAAMVQHQGASSGSGPLHSHDFWEALYILEGCGEHQVGNELLPLQPGELLLVRPRDCHATRSGHGARLVYINIAFPAAAWTSFCSVAGLEEEHAKWEAAPSPLCLMVPEPAREGCAETFRDALHAFTFGPTKLDLCCFWSALTRRLVLDDRPKWKARSEPPAWLKRALIAMELPRNLRAGLPRLRQLSGVSPAYLARSVRLVLDQSPTEYLNELRLRRASLLLRTTTREIIDIANDCGFQNLSYFYRLFRARYGCPPRSYRLIVSEQIAPGQSAMGGHRTDSVAVEEAEW